jgi:hypothetical protein
VTGCARCAADKEDDMKTKLVALFAALLLPALAWAGSGMCDLPCGDHCPIPCKDCPFAKR